MSEQAVETSNVDRPDKRFFRAVSGALKNAGFRHGALIYRAETDFTIDQAVQGLRRGVGSHSVLGFTTKVERLAFKMEVTAVRCCSPICMTEFVLSLFDGLHHVKEENCFILEGLLIRSLSSDGMVDDYATSDAYDCGEFGDESPGSLVDDEDFHLKVVAVVACDTDGRVVDAIVQKVPSPADEILYIPRT